MTKDAADSLGKVFETKTEHLKDIADQRGTVTESDMRDMAREIVKTSTRTFQPMSEKAGVKPTHEYRDLMQKLMLLRDGEISSDQVPSVSEIDRILAENSKNLSDAIK